MRSASAVAGTFPYCPPWGAEPAPHARPSRSTSYAVILRQFTNKICCKYNDKEYIFAMPSRCPNPDCPKGRWRQASVPPLHPPPSQGAAGSLCETQAQACLLFSAGGIVCPAGIPVPALSPLPRGSPLGLVFMHSAVPGKRGGALRRGGFRLNAAVLRRTPAFSSGPVLPGFAQALDP